MMKTAIQVRQSTTGKLRYRVVQEISDHTDYSIVPLTRWCGSAEGARKAHRRLRKANGNEGELI